MRGFRRESPASNSIHKKNIEPNTSSRTTSAKAPSHPPPTAPDSGGSRGGSSPADTRMTDLPGGNSNSHGPGNNLDSKVKYCHFFVNQGRCTFEEKSGRKCKFEHSRAPMCNFGVRCTRLKCMFSHSRNGSTVFLGRKYPPMMAPWPVMNPWMTTPPGQRLNSWAWAGNQNL